VLISRNPMTQPLKEAATLERRYKPQLSFDLRGDDCGAIKCEANATFPVGRVRASQGHHP
jgi:hypothetical protein